jgi:hypothetical protein
VLMKYLRRLAALESRVAALRVPPKVWEIRRGESEDEALQRYCVLYGDACPKMLLPADLTEEEWDAEFGTLQKRV